MGGILSCRFLKMSGATAQVSMKRLHHIIYDFKKLLFYDLEEPGIFANTL